MIKIKNSTMRRVTVAAMAVFLTGLPASLPMTAYADAWEKTAETTTGGRTDCTHVYGPELTVLQPTVKKAGKSITKCIRCSQKITKSVYGSGIYNGGYYVNGQPQTGVSGVIKVGSEKGKNVWVCLKNGQVVKGPTVEKNENGWWYIDKNGYVDFSYTGFAKNAKGEWYIVDGKVPFDGTTGIYKDEYGVLEKNAWFYVDNSKVTYTYVIDGVTQNETVAKNANGWWYVKNGKVDFGPYQIDGQSRSTTVKKNENGWWYIREGKVIFEYTGVAKNENGWWYIESGKVNFNYNGLASNENGTWVIENGKVNLNYNGKYTWKGKTYQISGGRVVS